ncbi:MAG: xylulokinase [Micromonosporaceae bacterium]|nr:xylulokinase [Micromonosporaceae bacterium]
MTLVAGIDSSTQSCKVVVCDTDTGAVVRQARAPHPDTTEVDPGVWWDAWQEASSGLLDGVRALAVAGQQHGMVTLDDAGDVVRPALLWNDTRSAHAASDLVAELGGADAWAKAVGSVPVASFTVTKLRWLASHEPALADRVERVLLPHDWLTWRLLGGDAAEPVTDRGDASGTGYWSPSSGEYRDDLLRRAFGRQIGLPRVAGPAETVGQTSDGILVGPGTGDNMGAALGLGARDGDVVVSLGTSGTVFAVHPDAVADPSGAVAGFADATGRYLPLVCTLNAARVLSAAAGMLGADLASLDRLALAAEPGAGGLVLLPYLDGERTPNLPDVAGSLHGLRRANMTPENFARAAVEGMLCGLADGLDALRDVGVRVRRILLVGGGARSEAVQAAAPVILGAPVTVPGPGEYVALGAARQAAWVLAGTAEPPEWTVDAASALDAADAAAADTGVADTGAGEAVRSRYTEARRAAHG